MTKGLLAKFKKQYGKDGLFASLSHRLHKGFEGFGNTAGRVKNEDEPQVRSERQIKEQQYRNSKHNWLFLSFLLLGYIYIYLYIFFPLADLRLYQLVKTNNLTNYCSFYITLHFSVGKIYRQQQDAINNFILKSIVIKT